VPKNAALGYLQQELDYLVRHGYQFVNQWCLVKRS